MNSPATSPPSSVDPGSDDDFTTALMRGVAKKLGVSYDTKVRSASYDAHAVSEPKLNSTSIAPVGLPGILRQIELRSKALGENHQSVCELHLQAADLLLDDQKADDHLFMALSNCRNRGGENTPDAVNVLSRMGALHARRGHYLQAQEAFRQASEICGSLEAGRAPVKAVNPSNDHLRSVLAKLASERSEIARYVASSLPSKNVPTTCSSDTQTDGEAVFVPPPTYTLSKEQLQRLRSPALRNANELKKLVSYVTNSEAVAAASATKEVIAKTTSPHFSRGKTSMQSLLETLERVKNPVTTTDFQSATQREVARILLEQYSADESQ